MSSPATGRRSLLASNDSEDKADFQDATKFLTSGGQKGPQRKILRDGRDLLERIYDRIAV
jgi:hypothetical protein